MYLSRSGEMADAQVSRTCGRNPVRVQVPPSVLLEGIAVGLLSGLENRPVVKARRGFDSLTFRFWKRVQLACYSVLKTVTRKGRRFDSCLFRSLFNGSDPAG